MSSDSRVLILRRMGPRVGFRGARLRYFVQRSRLRGVHEMILSLEASTTSLREEPAPSRSPWAFERDPNLHQVADAAAP